MPNVKARVRSLKNEDGKIIATLEVNEKIAKIGTLVSIKWGAIRSLSQNNLYWLYLNWLIEHGGLKDHGHFDPQALHLDLKAHFLAEKIMDKGKFKAIEEATTTTLDKSSFGEYFDKVNEFMISFFGVDVQPFWEEYAQNKI